MNITSVQCELLILLSRIENTESELQHINELVLKVRDWSTFYELSEHNRFAPFIFKKLQSLKLDSHIKGNVRDLFLENIKDIDFRNQKRLDEGKKFLSIFSKNKIQVIILKGIHFAQDFYNDPFYKRMNDIDIMIHKKDLKKIFKVYNDLKYFSAGELLGKSAEEHEEFSHHLPPFFSRNLDLMIGTHWELVSPMRPYQIDHKAIWDRVKTFNFLNLDLHAMAPIDNLHHLCVHLNKYKSGVREIADIYNLLRAYKGKIDWELFLKEVYKAKSYNPVYFALCLSHRLDPMSEVAFIIDELSEYVSQKTKREASEKCGTLKGLLLSRSIQITKVDKFFTSFKSTKDPKEKVYFYFKIWGSMLNPCNEEISRLSFIIKPTKLQLLVGKIKVPYKLMSSLCDDLGTKMFLLLILYTTVVTLKTVLLSPFTSVKDNAQEFANKLGLTLNELEELKDRLE
ncbi:MAG: hypothetical protein ACI9QD_000183 [Thermoproteota archaeon]|jgi:hypothetical protein